MKIYVNHAHIMPGHKMPDAMPEDLLKLMDECGIEGSVAFAPFSDYIEGDTTKWLKERIKGYDRLYGFGTVDFNKDIPEQIDAILSAGFYGIKIHPAHQRIHILDERLLQVYELAQKHNLFITFHTGVHWFRISYYNQLLFDEVAFLYPKLNISMEHVGGYSFFNDAIAVLINSVNTYAGLTSVSAPHDQKFWYLSDKQMSDLMWQVGANRCILGLDFPYNRAQQTKIDIARIMDMDLSQTDKELILGKNLLRLLKV